MEADAKEPTGVTRGQNAVHVMSLDWPSAEPVLRHQIARIDVARAETQLLVITADAENAVSAAQVIAEIVAEQPISVLAATPSARATRLLRAAPAHVVTGAPAELVALLQASVLKPAAVRGVVLAWLDPILETPDAAPLENLLGELPKDGARVVLAAALTPAHEAVIERYARRARREVPVAVEGLPPLAAEYVATTASVRGTTLRRLLDALDLPRAELYARSDAVRAEAVVVARSLGYASDAVRLTRSGDAASPDPLVLLELPLTADEMRALAGAAGRKLYALLQPSQLPSLRALLGGGALAPVALLEAAERARGKDAALRAGLRELLSTSDVRREVLALEPLLAEFDGIEIAAAALRLLEQQRPARPAAAAQAGPMQRLFLNLGEKDGVRPNEIVGAITAEAGIPGSQIGKVEVRDTHTIVEVAAAVSEMVVGKLSGAVVRGRKVQARLDQPREERPARSGPPRDKGDRGDRGERPQRSRGFDRGERPARPFDKSDRPARPAAPRSGPPRGDRPARPFNRDASGPTRKFDRDGGSARPTRPRPPRDDA